MLSDSAVGRRGHGTAFAIALTVLCAAGCKDRDAGPASRGAAPILPGDPALAADHQPLTEGSLGHHHDGPVPFVECPVTGDDRAIPTS